MAVMTGEVTVVDAEVTVVGIVVEGVKVVEEQEDVAKVEEEDVVRAVESVGNVVGIVVKAVESVGTVVGIVAEIVVVTEGTVEELLEEVEDVAEEEEARDWTRRMPVPSHHFKHDVKDVGDLGVNIIRDMGQCREEGASGELPSARILDNTLFDCLICCHS